MKTAGSKYKTIFSNTFNVGDEFDTKFFGQELRVRVVTKEESFDADNAVGYVEVVAARLSCGVG